MGGGEGGRACEHPSIVILVRLPSHAHNMGCMVPRDGPTTYGEADHDYYEDRALLRSPSLPPLSHTQHHQQLILLTGEKNKERKQEEGSVSVQPVSGTNIIGLGRELGQEKYFSPPSQL